jgi:hypothetical protein
MNVNSSSSTVTVACICTSDYLWQFEMLAKSIRKWSDFNIILCVPDVEQSPAVQSELVDGYVLLNEIAGTDADLLRSIYSGIELCCVLKPYVMQYVVSRYGRCLYVDNDILFYSDLSHLCEYYGLGDVVLFPHRLYLDNNNIENLATNIQVVKTGYFNAGMLLASTNGWDALEHWKQSIKLSCVIDIDNGLYVDQIWICSMFTSTSKIGVCIDAGHNIAYWNFDERTPGIANLSTKQVEVRSIHFSGFNGDMLKQSRASKYSSTRIPDYLFPYFADYAEEFLACEKTRTSIVKSAELSFASKQRARLGVLIAGRGSSNGFISIPEIEKCANSSTVTDYLRHKSEESVILLTRKTFPLLIVALVTKVIRKLSRTSR